MVLMSAPLHCSSPGLRSLRWFLVAVLSLLLILVGAPSSAPERSIPADPVETAAPGAMTSLRADEADLRRKIGQMIMVGFQGTSLADHGVRVLLDQIAEGKVGGVLYLSGNVASQAAVTEMNRAFAAAAGVLPPFIAVDQEGGRIQRLTRRIGFAGVQSARWVGGNMDPNSARQVYARLADGLRALGFNTNLGPVVDVDVNRANPIIARLGRSYSPDENVVTAFGEAFVEGHRDAGLATALKHFPGHGSSHSDSHIMLPDISRTWSRRELTPYRRLISRGLADMVMIGHLRLDRYTRAGGKSPPATMSKKLVTELLRDRLNYRGVVISDDLEMGAIRAKYSIEDALIGAVRAGIDILIVSNFITRDPSLPDKLVDILAAEARRDENFRNLIETSHRRILMLKLRLFGAKRASPQAGVEGAPVHKTAKPTAGCRAARGPRG